MSSFVDQLSADVYVSADKSVRFLRRQLGQYEQRSSQHLLWILTVLLRRVFSPFVDAWHNQWWKISCCFLKYGNVENKTFWRERVWCGLIRRPPFHWALQWLVFSRDWRRWRATIQFNNVNFSYLTQAGSVPYCNSSADALLNRLFFCIPAGRPVRVQHSPCTKSVCK